MTGAVLDIQSKFQKVGPLLNERQRRIWAAIEAQSQGRGGVSQVSRAIHMSRNTIKRGITDIEEPTELFKDRIRKIGGGRKRKEVLDPTLREEILRLVSPTTRGDPMSPLRWNGKSLRKLVTALNQADPARQISVSVVRRILKEENYSLQKNQKTKEGGTHPDRNLQFLKIAQDVDAFITTNDPVISIDAKKKELVGNFKNDGQEWNPKGHPSEVEVYDYLATDQVKATPYGIYDIAQNTGFVCLGISADTAVFAGRSILAWWEEVGCQIYPQAKRLLITADGGGSNGRRVHLWKVIVQELATKIGVPITVHHYPPGTSKWNKIEHRLFAAISMNWRGIPLQTLEQIQGLIAHTTTCGGLKVQCNVDLRDYPRGIKISANQMARLQLEQDNFHGEWNYTLYPRKGEN